MCLLESYRRGLVKIHGLCILPKNGFYALAYVPRNAKVTAFQRNDDCHREHVSDMVTLSSSYSALRVVVAIVQVLYTSITVYKATKGPQINQYGFTAFGLTASPYLIMSLFNLVGNLLTPNYDTLYIVHSPILDEAISDHDALIDGTVGALVMKEDPKETVQVEDRMLSQAMAVVTPGLKMTTTQEFTLPTNEVCTFPTIKVLYRVFFSCPVIERTDDILQTRVLREPATKTWGGYFHPENRVDIYVPWYSYLFSTTIYLFVDSLSLLPIGILSRFRKNNSTNGQQAWILCWMVVGVVIGPIAVLLDFVLNFRNMGKKDLDETAKNGWLLLFALVFIVPGIGGFMVVGRMLREYGDCVNLF